MPTIGATDLDVFPLCLGGNVFGWTADERRAFTVLAAYADAGGNFLDTADSYTRWVEGSSGGESETIIGRWMAARGNRDRIVVATKVGKLPARRGLAPATIRAAAAESLVRLGTDRIDLSYAHEDDADAPIEQTLEAFGELIAAGTVRHIGASNFTAPRLAEALAAARDSG
jgi:aryl-alcohol dehydrogenase-like predicted oxidoreductase